MAGVVQISASSSDHRYTDKYLGLESSGFSCRIIVTRSSNIFKFITQKAGSTLVTTS